MLLRYATALLFWVAATSSAVYAQSCRQALLLGLDVSLSVDPMDFTLQREGLSRALLDPAVQNAMLSNGGDHIELAIYEWSGGLDQTLLVDWTVIDTPVKLQRIALSLLSTPQQTRSARTALGASLQHAQTLLLDRGHCENLTLDVSGDGINNSGIGPKPARDQMESLGIMVNALVIEATPQEQTQGGLSTGQLTDYFYDNVITGPSAFVETIVGFTAYEDAIKRKLMRELIPSFVDNRPPKIHRTDRPAIRRIYSWDDNRPGTSQS